LKPRPTEGTSVDPGGRVEPAGAGVAPGAASKLLVDRIADGRSLEALEPEWRTLLEASRADCVFLTWEWVTAWWRHFGVGRALWVLVARDGSGTLQGIAPLFLDRMAAAPGLRVRALTWIGLGGPLAPDYLDIIAPENRERAAAEAFLAWLDAHAPEWDVVYGRQIADDSTGMAQLRVEAVRRGYWVVQGVSQEARYASLPSRMEQYEKECLGQKSRHTLRTDRNRIGREGKLLFADLAREWPPERCIAALAELHGARGQMLERGSAFERPGYRAFHEEFARLAAERRWLRMPSYLSQGAPVAARYGLAYRGTLYEYQTGFDPAFARQGVGRVLLAESIRASIEEGLGRFDMLGGASALKRQFCPESRWQNTLILAPPDRRGVILPLRRLAPSLLRARRRREAPGPDAEGA